MFNRGGKVFWWFSVKIFWDGVAQKFLGVGVIFGGGKVKYYWGGMAKNFWF